MWTSPNDPIIKNTEAQEDLYEERLWETFHHLSHKFEPYT